MNPERTKRRREQRLAGLRRRAAVVSTFGFAAFLGLAAQHAVGSTKRVAVKARVAPRAAAPARYFDQSSDGYAFDDGSAAPSSPSPPPPPPVAQTNVS